MNPLSAVATVYLAISSALTFNRKLIVNIL